MSFKVLCWTTNDVNGASNALRFETKDEAEAYARDLFMRWTALDRWSAIACPDPVTYRFVEGRLVAVEEAKS